MPVPSSAVTKSPGRTVWPFPPYSAAGMKGNGGSYPAPSNSAPRERATPRADCSPRTPPPSAPAPLDERLGQDVALVRAHVGQRRVDGDRGVGDERPRGGRPHEQHVAVA